MCDDNNCTDSIHQALYSDIVSALLEAGVPFRKCKKKEENLGHTGALNPKLKPRMLYIPRI